MMLATQQFLVLVLTLTLLAKSFSFINNPAPRISHSEIRSRSATLLHSSAGYSAEASLLLQKAELFRIGETTDRGFSCTRGQRSEAEKIITTLKNTQATAPALADLEGKWTLVYTDAPDITGLSQQPAARLGRVGQEIARGEGDSYVISNVIEWLRPRWLDRLPLGGFAGRLVGETDKGRVIQKVVTEGSERAGSSKSGVFVDLKIKGASFSPQGEDDELPVAFQILRDRPVDLRGGITLPFGSFEILYRDEALRIIKTSNGHYAVNAKDDITSSWF